jgi:zinc/manganese transport system substrate-binding protein
MKTIRLAALAAFSLLIAGAAPAAAKVNVVAANQDLAWITSTIGGNRVSVDYLARGDQDPHRIEPRPSQVLKLTQADMIVRIGMDLDLWMDALIQKASNGKIAPGGRGYVDASVGVRKLEVPSGKLDPSKGDIHVYGNPHYLIAPTNMRAVATNIENGLERVDPSGKATFEANFNALMGRVASAIQGWKAKLAGDRGKPIVTYHKSLVYFLDEFGLKEFGNVEPKPGLEPSPGHVASLAQQMKGAGVKVILAENYRPRRFSELLASQSGARLVVIPGGIGAEKGIDDYFDYIGAIVDRVSAAL